MYLLIAEKIEKVYGPANQQIKALNSLSLSIEIGEFLVIREAQRIGRPERFGRLRAGTARGDGCLAGTGLLGQ